MVSPPVDFIVVKQNMIDARRGQTNASVLLTALLIIFSFGLSVTAAVAEPIRGAGSTFAAPIIGKWARIYKDARADGGDYFTLDWTVDYERVGSLAGLMRLDQPEMDFAATDVPVPAAELAKHGRQQFPIVMGGIAIVANLDGVSAGKLRLTGPVLADIFLGKIKNWSDPAILALNPDSKLPDLAISVIHRQDGSGSSFALTSYLSAASDEWKAGPGADTLIKWPVGQGAEGTQKLIAAVQATKGAVSYAEYGQASRAALAIAEIQNNAGTFAMPDAAGVQAAASSVAWGQANGFAASLINQAGKDAYPISTATFAVVPIAGRSVHRYTQVHDFFRLAFDEGADEAEALGYVAVPKELVALIKQDWDKDLRAGN